MTLSNTIVVGLKEVWSHKFRSLLTMLGIILGVASLVGMAAIIKGMENGMRETMIAMGGADRVNVDQQDVPAEQEHLSDQAPGNTMADVEALRGCAPLMRLVSPKMDVDDLIVTHGDKTLMVWDAAGVWPAALEVYLHTVEHGRFFTDLDEENANPVCVIGTGIRDELFGSPEQTGQEIIPLGEIINLNGQPFTIVGMFTHYESEQDKKEREQAKKHPQAAQAGPARRKGWGARQLGLRAQEPHPLHAAQYRLGPLPGRRRCQRHPGQPALRHRPEGNQPRPTGPRSAADAEYPHAHPSRH